MNTAVLIWQSQKDLNHRREVLRPFLHVENSIDMLSSEKNTMKIAKIIFSEYFFMFSREKKNNDDLYICIYVDEKIHCSHY